MASNLADITKNSIEDGADDFVSAVIYRRMRILTEPFLKNFQSDSEFDEAMQSFIQTLSMGLTLYIYLKVMKVLGFLGKQMLVLWSYIVAGNFKKALAEKIKQSKFKGNKAFKVLGLVAGTDRTSERIEVAKLIKSNIDTIDNHSMHFQNQYMAYEDKIDNFSISASNIKSSNEQSYLLRYTHKTLTGTWENTNIDRKLFERATGKAVAEQGLGSWASLYSELNKYTEFAKTVEGEITNNAKSIQMMLSRSGLAS